jgi:hypothetical protein
VAVGFLRERELEREKVFFNPTFIDLLTRDRMRWTCNSLQEEVSIDHRSPKLTL